MSLVSSSNFLFFVCRDSSVSAAVEGSTAHCNSAKVEYNSHGVSFQVTNKIKEDDKIN